MTDDVRADARRLLQGITPGKWRHCTGPAEGESKAEYLAGCITNADESLHVVIAQSPEPKYAYVIPALTGDGPTSDANAEFIAAAPEITQRLLAELDRERDRALRLAIRATGCEKAESERDAALAVIAQVREMATDVDLYGGHSGPSLARTILNTVGGEK